VIVILAAVVLALMIVWWLGDRYLARARTRSRQSARRATPRQYLIYVSIGVTLIIGGWIVLHAR